MIEAVEISKKFERTIKKGRKTKKEEFLAVDKISLKAERGEIIGILGPNGAGKTTLLRMLGMLMTPTYGKIILKDRNDKIIEDTVTKKSMIGYLSGNTRLYSRISIREYLNIEGELYGFSKKECRARSEEIIKILNMESFADDKVEKLSTGQTQRASIARCLMADPDIYILDEPTLGLDIISADTIIKFMKEQKEKGKTVLYSTHYLEEAEMLCERIYMIYKGKIVISGTPEEIKAEMSASSLRGAFHKIFDNFSESLNKEEE